MNESNNFKDEKKFVSPNGNDQPPSYSEAIQQPSTMQNNEMKYPDDSKKGPAAGNNAWKQPNDSNINPNVYVVPPQLVNITRTNPQHLNPAYPIYLDRERERNMHGDFPNPDKYKHGAPLNFSNIPKNNTTSKGFPGRSGASYYNVANK